MAVLSRATVVAAALLAACYSPQIDECTLRCGTSGECPSGLTCAADDFCHADQGSLCDGRDAPLVPDGPLVDARPGIDSPIGGTPDAPVTEIDAPIGGTPDAPVVGTPDAPGLPDAPSSCIPILEDIVTTGTPQMGDISLAADGTLQVTYIRSASGEVWYASKAKGGAWQNDFVDFAIAVKKGQFLDAAGGLHIAYSDSSGNTQSLWYAHLATPGGAWSLPDRVTDQGDPIDSTITVDALANVHIAYYDKAAGELDHATPLAIGGWGVEPIDTGGDTDDVGEYPSIAYSPTPGRLFVTYSDVTNKTLKLASRTGGIWTSRTIDSSDDVGSFSALAIDGQGNLNIAYADSAAGTLRFLLINPSSVGGVRLLGDSPKSGRWNAIGLDPLGGVHISTFAFGDSDLHVAYRPAGGMFTAKPVETDGTVGRFTGIAVDSLGGAHVVYTDDTHGILRHAYVCPPTAQ